MSRTSDFAVVTGLGWGLPAVLRRSLYRFKKSWDCGAGDPRRNFDPNPALLQLPDVFFFYRSIPRPGIGFVLPAARHQQHPFRRSITRLVRARTRPTSISWDAASRRSSAPRRSSSRLAVGPRIGSLGAAIGAALLRRHPTRRAHHPSRRPSEESTCPMYVPGLLVLCLRAAHSRIAAPAPICCSQPSSEAWRRRRIHRHPSGAAESCSRTLLFRPSDSVAAGPPHQP
jgi:hypothetical protein